MKNLDDAGSLVRDGRLGSPEEGNRRFGKSEILAHLIAINNTRVFAIVLLSALAVITARGFAPFSVGKDQALQLEAAQRLVGGQGLTSTYFTTRGSADITEPESPQYLTWWPPALSLIVACFLFIGVPLSASLKIIYAITTGIGWISWAIIASRLLAKPLKFGAKSVPLNLLIAAVLPIFYTPSWGGTDIFLWAGSPIILLLLSSERKSRAPLALVALAGLLFGLLYALRYASLFIAVAAFLMLLQVSLPNIRSFLQKYIVFSLSSILIIAPTVVYIKVFSRVGSFVPSYVDLKDISETTTNASSAFWREMSGLPGLSNLVFGSPLVEIALSKIHSSFLTYAVGVGCLLVVLLLPLLLLKTRSSSTAMQDDIVLSLSLLPVSLVAFFLVTTLFLRWSPLGVRRYYEPVIFCLIFIFYQISSARRTSAVFRIASWAVLTSFLLYVLAYMPLQALIPERRAGAVQSVLGSTLPKSIESTSTSQSIPYPSNQVYSIKENARIKLKELASIYHEAVFYVDNYAFYLYRFDDLEQAGLVPAATLKRYPGNTDFWKQAYTSKPVKVFWVMTHPSTPSDFIPEDFIPDSNLRMIFVDPIEKTRILESDFPSGYKFIK